MTNCNVNNILSKSLSYKNLTILFVCFVSLVLIYYNQNGRLNTPQNYFTPHLRSDDAFTNPLLCDLASNKSLSFNEYKRNNAIYDAMIANQFNYDCNNRQFYLVDITFRKHHKLSIAAFLKQLAVHLLTAVALNKTMIYFNYSLMTVFNQNYWEYEPNKLNYKCENNLFGMDCYFKQITNCKINYSNVKNITQFYKQNIVNPNYPIIVRTNVTVPFWNNLKNINLKNNLGNVQKKWAWSTLCWIVVKWLLRFNRETKIVVDEILQSSFPLSFKPYQSMSIAVRKSDKCSRFDPITHRFHGGEMDCFTLTQHLEIANWVRDSIDNKLKYLVITSEDSSVFEKIRQLQSINDSLISKWIIIRNNYDKMPGTGNPRTWNGSYYKDDIFLSAITTLFVSSVSKYFQNTISSTWSRVIASFMIDSGCTNNGLMVKDKHIILLLSHSVNLASCNSFPMGHKKIVFDKQLMEKLQNKGINHFTNQSECFVKPFPDVLHPNNYIYRCQISDEYKL